MSRLCLVSEFRPDHAANAQAAWGMSSLNDMGVRHSGSPCFGHQTLLNVSTLRTSLILASALTNSRYFITSRYGSMLQSVFPRIGREDEKERKKEKGFGKVLLMQANLPYRKRFLTRSTRTSKSTFDNCFFFFLDQFRNTRTLFVREFIPLLEVDSSMPSALHSRNISSHPSSLCYSYLLLVL